MFLKFPDGDDQSDYLVPDEIKKQVADLTVLKSLDH